MITGSTQDGRAPPKAVLAAMRCHACAESAAGGPSSLGSGSGGPLPLAADLPSAGVAVQGRCCLDPLPADEQPPLERGRLLMATSIFGARCA